MRCPPPRAAHFFVTPSLFPLFFCLLMFFCYSVLLSVSSVLLSFSYVLLLLCLTDVWDALPYLYGDGLSLHAVCIDGHLHHTSPRVDSFVLVEDEVADAVIDGFPFVLFDGLHGMGVMANVFAISFNIFYNFDKRSIWLL